MPTVTQPNPARRSQWVLAKSRYEAQSIPTWDLLTGLVLTYCPIIIFNGCDETVNCRVAWSKVLDFSCANPADDGMSTERDEGYPWKLWRRYCELDNQSEKGEQENCQNNSALTNNGTERAVKYDWPWLGLFWACSSGTFTDSGVGNGGKSERGLSQARVITESQHDHVVLLTECV